MGDTMSQVANGERGVAAWPGVSLMAGHATFVRVFMVELSSLPALHQRLGIGHKTGCK